MSGIFIKGSLFLNNLSAVFKVLIIYMQTVELVLNKNIHFYTHFIFSNSNRAEVLNDKWLPTLQ